MQTSPSIHPQTIRRPRLACLAGSAHNGFTVLEMILSLFVATVLAVLLLSSLQKVRAKSAAAECVSRLKETGAAILLYAGEHRNDLPGPISGIGSPNYYTTPKEGSGLYTFLWRYLNLPAPPSETDYLTAKQGVCARAKGKPEKWISKSKFFNTGLHQKGTTPPYDVYPKYPLWNELPDQFVGTRYKKGRSAPFGGYHEDLNRPIGYPWKTTDVSLPSQLALLSDMPGNLQNPERYHQSNALPPEYHVHWNILFLDGHVDSWPTHPQAEKK